MNHNDKLPA